MSLACGFSMGLYHHVTAGGEYTLDGYEIMAFNQNLYGENEWDFYFWNPYKCIMF